jgi:hypothetical protein
MPYILIYGLIFLAVFTLGTLAWVVWRFFLRKDRALTALLGKYKIVEVQPLPTFMKDRLAIDSQSDQWRERMHKCGEQMKRHNLNHVVFISGTFVGNDPFGISRILENSALPMSKLSSEILKKIAHKGINKLIGDKGNFSHEYVKIFGEAIKHDISSQSFIWSSGNDHLARLVSAIELCQYISQLTIEKKKILLIGHSHAGQLFALITQMMTSSKKLKIFTDIASRANCSTESLKRDIDKLKECEIAMVTMGTPCRYFFEKNSNVSVLHLINHRGLTPYGGSWSGIPFTKDGDYIQQMAVCGSDIPSPTLELRNLNEELNQFLGVGFNLKEWKKNLKDKTIIHESGFNYLVNYQDDSNIPNVHMTNFGHASYTQFKSMLLNTQLIVDYFYKDIKN